MKIFNRNSRFFKTINLIVFYSFSLNIIVPSVHAMKTLYNTSKDYVFKTEELWSNINEKKSDLKSPNVIINSKKLSKYRSVSNGPGQTESGGFSIGSADGMVDKFTGDFSYSIPLADVEGYPISINYNSNINMSTESSMVGLGWSINVGDVTRDMRGLPDEFNGEQTIIKTINQAADKTTGRKLGGFLGAGKEISKYFLLSTQVTALKGKYYNNYIGKGSTFDATLQGMVSIYNEDVAFGLSKSIGISVDSKRGIGTNRSTSLSLMFGESDQTSGSLSYTFGKNYNSRSGLDSKMRGITGSISSVGVGNGIEIGMSNYIPYGTITSLPSVRLSSYGSSEMNSQSVFIGKTFTGGKQFRIGLQRIHYENDNHLFLAGHIVKQPAIGYFHSGKRSNFSSSMTSLPLMDFNRSTDVEYSEQMKNLPFSIQSFDVFSVNAMGISNVFRGKRTDIGTYYDPTVRAENFGDGANVSAGVIFKTTPTPGYKIITNFGENQMEGVMESGNFKDGSGENVLKFDYENKSNNFDKSVYFKSVGELTPENVSKFNDLGGVTPKNLDINITSDKKDIILSHDLLPSGSPAINSTVLNQNIEKFQATYFKPYTVLEYLQLNNTTYQSLKGFGPNMNTTGQSVINRFSGYGANSYGAANHITAVESVNKDGIKYLFEIPSYNLSTSQVSFCPNGLESTELNGMITYSSGDNSVNNSRGVSNYFDRTDIPAYAHTFLLTKILSSDYIDREGDGIISPDDIGSAYKINYRQEYGNSNPYTWRFPMEPNRALLSKNNLGTTQDDLANYSFGSKEIWYVHSIESKNLIAEFVLNEDIDPRLDGYALDENGVLVESKPLRKLMKIQIFNRSERMNPITGGQAIPIQTIEFEYNNELCPHFPTNINNAQNTNSGKLTLKSIRSYSGKNSELGQYSYDFTYDQQNNTPYSSYNVDVWGNSKPVVSSSNTRTPDLFPYAYQDENFANNNSKSWKLVSIKTPLHGKINIEYEADSYSTVQDSRTMNHIDVFAMLNLVDFFKINSSTTWVAPTSATNDKTFSTKYDSESSLQNSIAGWSNSDFTSFKKKFLKNGNSSSDYKNNYGEIDIEMFPNNVIVFKLNSKSPIANSTSKIIADQLVKEQYFTNLFNNGSKQVIDELYLKLMVNVNSQKTEMLPSFAKIMEDKTNVFDGKIPYNDKLTSIGVMPKVNGEYQFGYVVIEPAQIDNHENKNGEDSDISKSTQMNPLQKNAIEYIRRNLPDLVYGACIDCLGDNELDWAVALPFLGKDINKEMYKRNWALSFTDNTTLRLFTSNNIKYGGNGRVKSIEYSDDWQSISSVTTQPIAGEYTSNYKWNYIYDYKNESTGNAASEPKPVIDEYPMYGWDMYTNIVKKYPDNSKFTPTPIAIDLLPAPVIGYSRVEVKFNSNKISGKSVSEFHTTRQHPFIEIIGNLDKSNHVDKPTRTITGRTTDIYGYSQGFVIKTNDYHGKPSQNLVYFIDQSNNDILQSRTTYNYLDNNETVKMIDRKGIITNENVSQEMDIHADSKYVTNHFESTSVGVNITVKMVYTPTFFVYLLPIPYFFKTQKDLNFNSHALIKHVNQSAVVKSIETEYLNSINNAENILYDKYTGNVILSSLKDEYNDNLYSINYPAHWYYKGLREKFSSQNNTVNISLDALGSITNSYIDEILTPGDRITLTDIAQSPIYYVAQNNQLTNTINGGLYLIKDDGSPLINLTGNHILKIISSNRDNRLNETMEAFTTKTNPLQIQTNGSLQLVIPTNDILQAGAISYKDRNSYNCNLSSKDKPSSNPELSKYFNPYKLGARGDLVLDGQYSWQSDRKNFISSFKSRYDGAYTSYSPMYFLSGTIWNKTNTVNHANWRKLGEITVFNQFGKPIESRDQLKVYSSVLYGYNNNLELVPIAQAINARQQEIGFDGFEDYNYYNTMPNINLETHFDFKNQLNTNVTIDNINKHTGLSSLKIAANASTTITKKVTLYCPSTEIIDDSRNGISAENCGCIQPFQPSPGTYLIGAWIKNNNPLNPSDGKIIISTLGGATPTVYPPFVPSGPVLDGWQRLEGIFNIPIDATEITITLSNGSTSSIVNFDDLRIHPNLAGMTTTVYDPKTLLPLASHDGYNFSTFYNYDENLNQVKVRVETIEGIKTVSETESGGYKTPKN